MRLPLNPYPRGGKTIDKLERALEWAVNKLIFNWKGYPVLSGLATGVMMSLVLVFFWGIFVVILYLQGHLK